MDRDRTDIEDEYAPTRAIPKLDGRLAFIIGGSDIIQVLCKMNLKVSTIMWKRCGTRIPDLSSENQDNL